MSELSLDMLSEKYSDWLKELGNIGAGNATTALAQMLGIRLDMAVPEVRLLEFGDVGGFMGGEEQIIAGIHLGIEGDVHGTLMFLLGRRSARQLVNILMMQESDSEEFTELELSALKELGNIITGSYLNSISMMTNLVMMPSVPDVSVDMCNAILSVPMIEYGVVADKILIIKTMFNAEEMSNDGYFILLPDMPSYEKILTALGATDFT